MTDFTPLASTGGGILIGLSAILLMAVNGRIAGISGIMAALLPPDRAATGLGWRLPFLAGILVAPVLIGVGLARAVDTNPAPAYAAHLLQHDVSGNLVLMAIAGLLVGFGAVFGNGCTSGHGVCGLSRLSVRSLAATATFIAVAIATVALTRHVWGG
ncbi:MAG: YeeE/YedE thiosulfate transporter family protein [Pseudomonadota bacterium]